MPILWSNCVFTHARLHLSYNSCVSRLSSCSEAAGSQWFFARVGEVVRTRAAHLALVFGLADQAQLENEVPNCL